MKNVKYLLIVVLLCVLFISVKGTYARYASAIDTKVKLSIANWIIKVNAKDITLEEEHEFTISNLYVDPIEYPYVNGKLAPGTEGTFTIALDARESSVSLEYDLNIDLSGIPNDKIVVKEVKEGTTKVNLSGSSYHNKVNLTKVKDDVILITVTIEWKDDENNTEADNNLGMIPNNQLSIPVSITVNQLIE